MLKPIFKKILCTVWKIVNCYKNDLSHSSKNTQMVNMDSKKILCTVWKIVNFYKNDLSQCPEYPNGKYG
jgi:hypothetical protein